MAGARVEEFEIVEADDDTSRYGSYVCELPRRGYGVVWSETDDSPDT
jgi:hypothetical protein